jgi:ATP-binding cassette subfamily F protein 3
MSLIRLNNLSKSFEEKPILREVFFRLSQGDRVGLIGRNGAGKTTLLKLILGLEEPNEGTVEIDQGIRIGYFSQFSALNGASSIQKELDLIFSEIHTLEEALVEIEIAHESEPAGDELDRLLSRQATITLSGGQRARVALAISLLSGASVILLDEPTNHLDMASTQVMERALAYFPGAVIVISHDRFFIDKIATQLLVFEGKGHIRKVNGNWTTWRAGVE